MKAKVRTAKRIIVAGLLSSSVFFAADNTVSAEVGSDYFKHRNQELKHLAKDEKQLKAVDKAVIKAKQKIRRMDLQVTKVSAKIVNLERKQKAQKQTISHLKEQYSNLDNAIAAKQQEIKEKVVSYYENGEQMQYLKVLAGTASIKDFISRVILINVMNESDRDILKGYFKGKEDNQSNQKKLAAEIKELEKQKTELKVLKKDLEKSRAEKKAYMAVLKNIQKNLQVYVLDSKEELNLLSAQEQQAAHEAEQEQLSLEGKIPLMPVGEWQTFLATYYDSNFQSTGKNPSDKGYGITKSGAPVQAGVTIAVDPAVIPLGTWVEIKYPDGKMEQRQAQDIGGMINGHHIDVYVPNADGYGKHDVQLRLMTYKETVKSGEEKGLFIRPATGSITSEHGEHRSYETHVGIDIGKNGRTEDVPIHAAASGTVIRSYLSSSYGNVVFIRHKVNGQVFTSVSAHMETRFVKEGDVVQQGQKIGLMGNTGYSFGPHLHFELHKGDWTPDKKNAVDPLKYLPR
ncbi:peptidoglycan DD-metalloendopeptidase family protein [Fictibacillus marinisediminis]|uniref:peptidoglycan DD-metalloendopeptidase family protein n=1 Tax=Fictibacillus marinisediminis TaxID=2878389 RepID=UPI0023515393|nr:peptidoglycan DD-metalloendopeptidase family protein [Fictibacillus marinisediminis]